MKKFVAWGLVIFWCVVIFSFSAQTGDQSTDRSMGIVQKIEKQITDPVVGDIENLQRTEQFNTIVRKTAHILEYFILTLLILNVLPSKQENGYKRYVLAFFLSISYAAFDELHQGYVPGRESSPLDVLIDGMGVVLGLTLFYMVSRYRGKKRKLGYWCL